MEKITVYKGQGRSDKEEAGFFSLGDGNGLVRSGFR